MDSRSIMIEILSGEVDASGMTRVEIARKLGVTQPYVTAILNGYKSFSIDMYGKILSVVGREPVFGTRPIPPGLNPPGEDPA